MAWYLASIIATLSFSVMILLIKRVRDLGFSSKKINLFLYSFVFLGFILANISTFNETMNLSNFWYSLGLIFFVSIVAMFANLANFKAVGIAPNPGYVQSIKDTHILPVTILSALIFGSEFNLAKFLGAVLVLIGAIFLIKKEFRKDSVTDLKEKVRLNPWHLYSLGTALLFVVYVLILKKITLLGFSSKEINLFLFGFGWIGLLTMNFKELREITFDKKFSRFLRLVFLASCFSLVGNLFGLQAIKTAPNPGYHSAIKSSYSLVVTFLSVKLFFSEARLLRILGVIVIILGITLLVL